MSEPTTVSIEMLRAQIAKYQKDLKAWPWPEPRVAYAVWRQRHDQIKAGLAEAERQLRELTGE